MGDDFTGFTPFRGCKRVHVKPKVQVNYSVIEREPNWTRMIRFKAVA
jgi:hypothetical protein